MRLMSWAALWGLAEATFFFFVPDILLTYIALKFGARRACMASVAAVFGATAGGVLMFLWGKHQFAFAMQAVDMVPAIGPGMFTLAASHLHDHGELGLFLGTSNGIPYKVYAVQAASIEIDLWRFALLSLPARLYRFLIAALLSAGVAYLLRQWSARSRYLFLAVFWLITYGIYFYHFL